MHFFFRGKGIKSRFSIDIVVGILTYFLRYEGGILFFIKHLKVASILWGSFLITSMR